MKAFLLLLSLIFTADAVAGLPPTTLRGQTQNTKTTTFNFEIPGAGATKTSTGTLIETNNLNQLSNPTFSHSTFSTSWTKTDTSGSASISAVTNYKMPTFKQSYRLSMTSWVGTVCGSVVTGNPTPKQSIATMWVAVSGAHTGKVCSRVDGVIQNCASLTTDTTDESFIEYVIQTVSTGSTAEICFVQDVAANDVVWLGGAWLGAMPATMSPSVSQAQYGSSYRAPTASCIWTRTNTAFGAPATVAACPGPTINNSPLFGSWQTTDTDLPDQTINNAPPGRYVVKAKTSLNNGTAGQFACAAVSDGTTTGQGACSSTNGTGDIIEVEPFLDITYTSTANRTFTVHLKSNSGAANMQQTANGAGLQFEVRYYPPADKVYSQTVYDSDWVSCGLTTSDFTGFGTVSSIQDQCKKDGSDLLVRLKFTSGTSTATEARVALKFAGTALTTASSTIIPSIQNAGTYGRGASAATHGGLVLIQPAVTYLNMTVADIFGSGTSNANTAGNGSGITASGETVSLYARIPIAGWTKSQITGTFAEMMRVPGVSKPKTCYYFFGGASATLAAPTECTTGTCVEVYDSCATGSAPSRTAAGIYENITWAAGTWANSTALDCDCTAYDTTTATDRACGSYFVTGDNTWSSSSSGGYVGNFTSSSHSGTASDAYMVVRCEGQAP